MKIGELINSYDGLVKQAFIPNPQAQQGGQPQDPSQGGGAPQQQGGGDQLQQAYAQLQQVLQQLPPEAQQQVAPMLQQLQQLPPDQQLQQITQLTQQLGQGAQQGGQSQEAPQGAQQEQAPKEEGHHNAENSLDNTKVTLSVRELLDLSSGGKATQSLLKVKQMADSHNKKMEVAQQQQEQQAAESQQAQQQQQSAMGQGGIYSQPMDGSAPAGQ